MSSSSATTAAEEIDIETLLPTYLQPRRAYTFPSIESLPYNDQAYSPRLQRSIRLAVLPDSGVERWFIYLVGFATIIGLVVSIVAIVVK